MAPTAPPEAAADRQVGAGTSRPRRACPTYITARRGRPLPRRARRARRHPARRLLPPVAGRATSTRTRSSRSPGRASTSSTTRSACRYPFGKYDQLFVPEFNAGRDGERGRVTFLEDYIFRSRVTDAGRRAPRRDDPARDGAHVVRRPGHHALVGRPVAERVVRHLGRHSWRRPRPPGGRTPGPRSRRPGRRGRTGRTSCRRPTRSPPTSPTSRPSRSTSTGSPTPRAPPCSSSSSPTSAGRTSWPACGATSASTPGATPTLGDLLAALEQTSGREPVRLVQGSGWRPPGSTRCGPSSRSTPTARFTSFAVLQEAPPATPVLRPHRIAIGLYDRGAGGLTRTAPGRARRRRRAHRGPGAGRAAAPRPGAGQRRRPDLRQDPARRALAADARCAAIGEFAEPLPGRALLGRGLGHDPGRARWPPGTTSRLVLSGVGRRSTDISVVQTVLRQATRGHAPVRRPGLAARPAWPGSPDALRDAAGPAEPGSDRQLAYAQAFTGGRHLRRRPGPARRAARRLRSRSTAWPSTPTCAGSCCTGWSAAASPARTRSTPSWTGTATDAGERHAASLPGRDSRRRRPRRRPGPRSSGGKLPNATFRATLGGFIDTDQDELLAPFAPRYFDVVADIWQDWGSDMAQYFAEVAYPARWSPRRRSTRTDDYIEPDRPAGGAAPAAHRGPRRRRPRAALPRARRPGGLAGPQTPRPAATAPDHGGSAGAGPRAGPAVPSPSHSGIRQFGYSSLVPGMFCVRRSPTASASDTPISRAGGAGQVAVQRDGELIRARRRAIRGAGPPPPAASRQRDNSCCAAIAFCLFGLGQQPQPGADGDLVAGEERRRPAARRGCPTVAMQSRRQCRGGSGEPSGSRANQSISVPSTRAGGQVARGSTARRCRGPRRSPAPRPGRPAPASAPTVAAVVVADVGAAVRRPCPRASHHSRISPIT